VLASMLDSVEQVGEVPGGVGGRDLTHAVRLSGLRGVGSAAPARGSLAPVKERVPKGEVMAASRAP
jgi:hypothetical protein